MVSWNVRSLRDGSRAVACTLRSLDPDLVVLQEAPRLVLWRLSRRLLAYRSGLRLATTGKAAGNVVLSRRPVQRSLAQAFPKRPGLHRRGAVLVVTELAGRPLAVAGTHLDLDPQARLQTAETVRRLCPDLPLVLGADVNEEPDGPAWQILAEGLVDHGAVPTFPARTPARRIDLLAASADLDVSLQVLPTTASDHRVLVAELSWADPIQAVPQTPAHRYPGPT